MNTTIWNEYFMISKMVKSLLLLLFVFSFGTYSDQANSSDISYEESKGFLKSGKISEGITGLQYLSNKDPKSAHLLGVIFLNGKLLPVNKDKAYKYFLLGAEQCFDKSIEVVEKLFLFKRGSEYFNPQKMIRIKEKCNSTDIASISKAPKPKEDHNTQSDNLISENVKASWEKIFVDPDNENLIGMGSGFAINKNGYFVTNEHVVEGCRSAIILYNGLLGGAQIVSKSKKYDLAILQVNAPTPYFVNFAPKTPLLGEEIIALGYPVTELFGYSPTFSFGTIKNTGQSESDIRDEGFLLVDLEIASGNSGGPVFNKKGGLRGVVSYGYDSSALEKLRNEEQGSNDHISSNTFTFIVSATSAKNWLNSRGVDFSTNTNQNYMNTEIVTSLGIKSLAKIGCLK